MRIKIIFGFPGGSVVKNLPAIQEIQVQSLGWEDPLEEETATHSSILAWKNPMDRGAWWATVYGVAKSQTQLSDWACKIAFKEHFIIWPFPHGHVAYCTLYNTLQHFLQHHTSSRSHSDDFSSFWVVGFWRAKALPPLSLHLPVPSTMLCR